MRSILIILFFLLMLSSVKTFAQKWYPGHFTDTKGNIEKGLIRVNPKGKGPVKDEGYIEFRYDGKTDPFKLSAEELRSFVIGRDSFVVAHPPGLETWANNGLDFVRVVLDEDYKLYAAGGVAEGSGGGGLSIEPGIATGIGTGGYGSGFGTAVGGGVSIPVFGGGGIRYEKEVFYYGDNTADMKRLNKGNFIDIMTDIMGDYPDIVDKIRAKIYTLRNIDKLIALYNQRKLSI